VYLKKNAACPHGLACRVGVQAGTSKPVAVCMLIPGHLKTLLDV
jgi:hypothetical protein